MGELNGERGTPETEYFRMGAAEFRDINENTVGN